MNFLKHHIIIIAVAAVASVGIVSYAVWGTGHSNNLSQVSVSRMSLQEEVHATGTVKAAQAVDLAFERGGKIVKVYAQAGDTVKSGETIVALDGSDLYAQLLQAEADIKTQQAKLDELRRGARPEDLETSQVRVSNAATALDEAKKAAVNAIQDAYTKADDVIHNRISEFIVSDVSDTKLLFYVNLWPLKDDLVKERPGMDTILAQWNSSIIGLDSTSDLSSAIADAKSNLGQIKSFIDQLSIAVNDPGSYFLVQGSATPLSIAQKSDMSNARSIMSGAISSVSSAEQGIKTAESNLASANQDLALKQSGSSVQQISAQEAQVLRSQAGADYVRSQLAKTVLRSPIDGVVSRQDAKAGAIASPSMPLVSVISASKYQIEIFVSEADVAKIKAGQAARVTLDAYGEGQSFNASVISVDPAATVANGVNAYKVVLQFADDDARIKAGMGANVNISTASRDNAIAVPESAVITRGTKKILLVELSKGVTEDRIVECGITGSNGYVEILSGLKEGERIAIFGSTQK